MIPREALVSELLFRIAHFPAVAVLGPRQVGKTTLVKSLLPQLDRQTYYYDLEMPEDANKFLQDPVFFLRSHEAHTVVLDEIHRLPDLFVLLRGLIDEARVPGRFVLLGSASPDLLRNTTESLAGRVSYLDVSPLTYSELQGRTTFWNHWLWGGFPNAVLPDSTRVKTLWLTDFLRSYVERDLPQLGLSAPVLTTRRLLTMIAAMQGGLLNYNTLANSLGITVPTVKAYVQFLERAYLLRTLPPYYAHLGKRLVKSPKIYLRDSGLLHHLLNLTDSESLLGHAVAGGSWEGYVLQEVFAGLPQHVTATFYRTADGAELDLVLEAGGQVKLALEIKLSNSPTLTRGTTEALGALGDPPLLVVTPSATDAHLRPGVWVCSVPTLAENLGRFL